MANRLLDDLLAIPNQYQIFVLDCVT